MGAMCIQVMYGHYRTCCSPQRQRGRPQEPLDGMLLGTTSTVEVACTCKLDGGLLSSWQWQTEGTKCLVAHV